MASILNELNILRHALLDQYVQSKNINKKTWLPEVGCTKIAAVVFLWLIKDYLHQSHKIHVNVQLPKTNH